MNSPFFSVIVPAYNRARFLPRCIDSVLKQSFGNWELLIVDDGSTDNTKEVVSAYIKKDSRVIYIFQTNQRVSAARNTGLKNAAGRFLCFLDSDDAYETGHLQFFYEELEKRNFANVFLATNFLYKDDSSEQVILAPEPKQYADKRLGNVMKAYLPFSPCVQTICIPGFIKEKVKFDTQLNLSECYDFCARAAALVDDVISFPIVTVTLYGHTGNASVPDGVDAAIRFHSTQYKEFLMMRKESFYASIAKTKAFKRKLFYLQSELMKSAVQKKCPGRFVISLFRTMRYNPFFLFKLNYARLLKKIVRKITRRQTAMPVS